METQEDFLKAFDSAGKPPQQETGQGKDIRVPVTFTTTDGRTYRATEREIRFVQLMTENVGKSLGEIARMAGYSDLKADNPQDIMSAKGVMALMEAAGSQMEDADLLTLHVGQARANKITTKKFPVYVPDSINEGECLTDAQLKESLTSHGYEIISLVKRIKDTGEGFREVTMYAPSYEYRDRALDKAYLIKGSYAPKKLDTKSESTHVHVSLTDLRRFAREKNLTILDMQKRIEAEAKDITENPGN